MFDLRLLNKVNEVKAAGYKVLAIGDTINL